MLGDDDQIDPSEFTRLCASGLEKDWIVEWFAPLASEYGFALTGIDICREDVWPDPNTIDAVIVGGTIHTVDEDRPWFHALKVWLEKYRETQKPLLGICGGHQFIATQMENGTLQLRPEGRLVGTYPVQVTAHGENHALMKKLSREQRFSFGNFYHVVPSEQHQANVLATYASSSAIALDHGGHWYSTQFHPESRLEAWQTFFAKRDSENIGFYTEDHDGEQLLCNFLEIARAAQ